jgi:hypothetical protein
MNDSAPTFVDFTISRPEPNIVILRFPEQIIVLNTVTQQALVVPAGIFYQAAVDEFQLGD